MFLSLYRYHKYLPSYSSKAIISCLSGYSEEVWRVQYVDVWRSVVERHWRRCVSSISTSQKSFKSILANSWSPQKISWWRVLMQTEGLVKVTPCSDRNVDWQNKNSPMDSSGFLWSSRLLMSDRVLESTDMNTFRMSYFILLLLFNTVSVHLTSWLAFITQERFLHFHPALRDVTSIGTYHLW